MAASAISPDQFAQLCEQCACLQLTSTTPDGVLPKNPLAGESGGEQEVDLAWNVADYGSFVCSEERRKCDCCKFLQIVVLWWQLLDRVVERLPDTTPVSLHYVFRLDETIGYGLRALRIRRRLGGQECHVDCPIAAATDLDVGTPLGLQPPLSHINGKNITWMKSRLESCVSHNHFKPDKTFIPDRLIDVRGNQLSLVLTKDFQPRDAEIHRYVALTYCWGPEPHASKQLKTTRDNISQHMRQIPESALPQVIKDAVAVTRALSIPFLWIDALCILQDNLSDWENQCAVMEQIYGNAYTTVAAVSSHNCEEGFVHRTDRILFPFRSDSGDTRVFGIYPPPDQADTEQEVPYGPWIKRGWTFQERIAATRILMFSKGSLHFDCKDLSITQGVAEKIDRDYYYIMLDRETIDSGRTEAIYTEWSRLMAKIKPKTHQFTRKTDFLPSISGIASLFSKGLDDDYAAGLWKKSMHQSLCWALSTTGKPRYQDLLKALKTPSSYIAPSWSWASRNEAFSFDLYNPDLSADCRREYHSIDTAITLRGKSVFGEVKDAALSITSRVYVGSPKLTLHEKTRRSQGHAARLDGRYFADTQTDWSGQDIREGHTLATLISFLLIGSTIRRETDAGDFPPRGSGNPEVLRDEANARLNSESLSASTVSAECGGDLENETICKRVAYGLLIHPTGNSNEYYRVGTFFSDPDFGGGLSIFDNVEVRTVRLV